MRILIVEDDNTSLILMQEMLKSHGSVSVARSGREAVEAVSRSLRDNEPFDLICLDIMMPDMDGQTALAEIRKLEESRGILSTDGAKIVMTTALDDVKNVSRAFKGLCDSYIVKPISREKLTSTLNQLGLGK